MFRSLRSTLALLLAAAPLPALAQGPVKTPDVHAFTGATIVTAPGETIAGGTLVIRDGLVEAVGATVPVPADAVVHDCDSLWIWPGLIDLRMDVPLPEPPDKDEAPGALAHELEVVHPEFVLADHLVLKDSDRDARRRAGILTVRALPGKGTFRGQAAVLNLGNGPVGENLLEREAGQVLSFSGARNRYPASTMGVVAVLRQTLADAAWYAEAHAAYAKDPRGLRRPETDAALAALGPALSGRTPFLFVTNDMLDVLRAADIAREAGVTFAYLGSGEEYKRVDELREVTDAFVVPVAFPPAPRVKGELGQDLTIDIQTLRHWDSAPANPATLHGKGFRIALTAEGLRDAGSFREKVAESIERGLPRDAALAACTTVPAEVAGISDRVGRIAPGLLANLVITDGELFADSTAVREVWIDGETYEVEKKEPPRGDPRGAWDYVARGGDGSEYPGSVRIAGEIGGLTGTISVMGQEIEATVVQSGDKVVFSFPGDGLGVSGLFRFNFTFQGDSGSGSGTSPMGDFTLTLTRVESSGDAPGGAR